MTEDNFMHPALVFAGLLFGICLLTMTFRVVRKRGSAAFPHFGAWLCGVATLWGVVIATYYYVTTQLNLNGEPLQLPLLISALAGGFASGLIMAAITKRIAFFEALCVVAIGSLFPVYFASTPELLFSYGTSAAYFGIVLLSWNLILILSLALGGAIGYLLTGDGRFSLSFGYESWMGARFLMTKQSSGAISVITLISVIAVTVGCAGMIVVMSVMNGFSHDLRSKIMGANAHLTLSKYGGRAVFVEYPEVLRQTINLPGIRGASPFILSEVMISFDRSVGGAVIKGIDTDTVGDISSLPESMIEGELSGLKHPQEIAVRPPPKKGSGSEVDRIADALDRASDDEDENADTVLPGIVVGREMARALRAQVGDVLNVVSPIAELGPSGPIPKAKAFRLAGVFYTGMFDYDSKLVYIDMGTAQEFFSMKNAVTGIEYKLADADQTQAASRAIKDVVHGSPYETKDWMQMNRPLFSALKLEKIAMFIILLALILMASLLILVALIMVVIEKGKEIAIMKSMGASDTSIMKLFVTYGLIIGGSGSFFGLLTGVGLCELLKLFGIGLDPQIYYITHIPVLIEPVEVAIVSIGALIISFFATIPPSLFASRLKPVEGLRYE